ncbi:MAG: hypothetical protein LUG52_08905 [Clostridia bacterium]|nr:hypothetical protein [Clostridia bacterium]
MPKRICSVFIIFVLLSFVLPAFASGSYITITPFDYNYYTLGESITVKGTTDFSYVTLSLNYPEDSIFSGASKYVVVLSADQFESGYTIKLGAAARSWPEGEWSFRVQNGDVSDRVYVNFSSETVYDRTLRVAKYQDGILVGISAYPTRGAVFNGTSVSFALEDDITVRFFQWNDALSPVTSGDVTIRVAVYEDDMLTSVSHCTGTFSARLPITMTDGVYTYKIFCWDDNLIPQ